MLVFWKQIYIPFVDRLNAERGKLAEAKNQILEYSKERRRFVEQMRNLRS